MKPVSILLAGVLLASTIGGTALAQQAPSGPVSSAPAAETDAFGERVRAYLLEHPEVIMEAVQIYQDRQQAAQAETAKSTITARSDTLFHDPASPVGGNPDGDVTLVEFFDYNCPYCRVAAPVMTELTKADPNLRVVYKEFPILGPVSEIAARAALAAERQGRYQAFHDGLMQQEGNLTEDRVFEVAAQVGLDLPKLTRDMADAATDRALQETHALALSLGINGTPGFVIGDQIIPGAVERKTLEDLIAQQRAKPADPEPTDP